MNSFNKTEAADADDVWTNLSQADEDDLEKI